MAVTEASPPREIARTKPTGPWWKKGNLRNEPIPSLFLHIRPIVCDEGCMQWTRGSRLDDVDESATPILRNEPNPAKMAVALVSAVARERDERSHDERGEGDCTDRRSLVGIGPAAGRTPVDRVGGIGKPESDSSAGSGGYGNESRARTGPGDGSDGGRHRACEDSAPLRVRPFPRHQDRLDDPGQQVGQRMDEKPPKAARRVLCEHRGASPGGTPVLTEHPTMPPARPSRTFSETRCGKVMKSLPLREIDE